MNFGPQTAKNRTVVCAYPIASTYKCPVSHSTPPLLARCACSSLRVDHATLKTDFLYVATVTDKPRRAALRWAMPRFLVNIVLLKTGSNLFNVYDRKNQLRSTGYSALSSPSRLMRRTHTHTHTQRDSVRDGRRQYLLRSLSDGEGKNYSTNEHVLAYTFNPSLVARYKCLLKIPVVHVVRLNCTVSYYTVIVLVLVNKYDEEDDVGV